MVGRLLFVALLLGASPSALGAITWADVSVDPTPSAGWTCSLGVGPSELPSIAYWTPWDSVRFASYDGSQWHIEAVPRNGSSVPDAGALPSAAENALIVRTVETSLALDPLGAPWVAHTLIDQNNDNRGMVEVSHREGGAWVTEDLVIGNTRPSIAVDRAGVAHLCFGSPAGLTYAVRTEAGWTYEIVDPASVVSAWPSLALDEQGGAHVAYMSWSPQAIRYAERSDGAWQRTIVDSTPGVVLPAVAVRDPDRPYIAYVRVVGSGDSRQRLAKRVDGAWSYQETSSPTSSIYGGLSLALGCSGQALIAYSRADQSLWLATVDDGGWSFEQVAPSATYVSLVLDSAGVPRIAHASSSGLRLAIGTAVASVPPAPPPGQFRLLCGPNPARLGAALGLTLESLRADEVRFEAFDLCGRRLAASRAYAIGPGVSRLAWDAWLAAGLFWVRARTAAGAQSVTRVVVIP